MASATKHQNFVTTTRGLRREIPPMRLYEKAKKFGVWNPTEIDFTQDVTDWAALKEDEKDIVLRLTSLFAAGEEAVTLDLLPLIMAIAKEGRLEEEIFLTTFLWEEAKHTDFFQRFLNEVLEIDGNDLTHFHGPNYSHVFYDVLPDALDRLMTDQAPEAQIKAAVTYNMIVEGVLAETGYHAYFSMLKNNGLMPGNTKGVNLIKQDESRHIAYGIFLISRLVAENHALWDIAETTMNELLMPAISVVTEVFEPYDPIPFGLVVDDFVNYDMMQFQKRMDRIEASRNAPLDEIYRMTHTVIDTDDA